MPIVAFFHLLNAPSFVANTGTPRPTRPSPLLVPIKGWYWSIKDGITILWGLRLFGLRCGWRIPECFAGNHGPKQFESIGWRCSWFGATFPDGRVLKNDPNASISVCEDEFGRHGSTAHERGSHDHPARSEPRFAQFRGSIRGDGEGFGLHGIKAGFAVGAFGAHDNLVRVRNCVECFVVGQVDGGNGFVLNVANIIIGGPNAFPGSLGVIFFKEFPLDCRIVFDFFCTTFWIVGK